jgi:competence protein ComEC
MVTLRTAHFILEFYEVLCRTAGKLPYARIVTGKPKLWQCVVYVLLLALFVGLSYFSLNFWQKLLFNTIKGESVAELKKVAENTKTVKRLQIVILLAGIMLFMLPKKPSFEIDMLDVGQGDGIYMMTPEGETYLFDGGSSDEKNLAQNTLVPFLKSKGVAQIDYALVSHTDTDHISGVTELMQGDEIAVGAVLLPEALKNCDDENYIKFIKIAQDCNIPVWHVKTGDFVGNSQVTVQCLHPEISYHTDSVNDISAVYRIDYGKFSMLMTGDAGMNVENELLEKGVLSPVTILKTGHHGSKSASSEAFLEKIRPQAALISCGVNNRYHHPSEEVIQRLKKMDIQTKVTAQCGQITVKSDGKTYRLPAAGVEYP